MSKPTRMVYRWAIRSQALNNAKHCFVCSFLDNTNKALVALRAVHRLDVGGGWKKNPSFFHLIRYSRARPERVGDVFIFLYVKNDRRYRRSLNHKLCRLGIGGLSFLRLSAPYGKPQVFGFWGELTGQNNRRLQNTVPR